MHAHTVGFQAWNSVGQTHLSPEQLLAAYCTLVAAAAYNGFVQVQLPRRPSLFRSGYLTTLGDGLLNAAMLAVSGGFGTPLYALLYTVTVASAMRYGYGPADTIKIDKCFVDGLGVNPEDSAIIAFARGVGMTTTAEGVEDVEQLAQLRRMGTDRVQGYYYSKAVPADQLELLFRQKRSTLEDAPRVRRAA